MKIRAWLLSAAVALAVICLAQIGAAAQQTW